MSCVLTIFVLVVSAGASCSTSVSQIKAREPVEPRQPMSEPQPVSEPERKFITIPCPLCHLYLHNAEDAHTHVNRCLDAAANVNLQMSFVKPSWPNREDCSNFFQACLFLSQGRALAGPVWASRRYWNSCPSNTVFFLIQSWWHSGSLFTTEPVHPLCNDLMEFLVEDVTTLVVDYIGFDDSFLNWQCHRVVWDCLSSIDRKFALVRSTGNVEQLSKALFSCLDDSSHAFMKTLSTFIGEHQMFLCKYQEISRIQTTLVFY